MKYKDAKSGQAILQGFNKDLDKRAWDVDDATDRLDTGLSKDVELFGE